jgi:hypothetical protein
MWSTCSLLARAGITCYSFHALCITADRIGLTAAAVQECAQPHLHSGHAPYYKTMVGTTPWHIPAVLKMTFWTKTQSG